MNETGDGQSTRAAGFAAALLSGAVMGVTWPLQKYVLGQGVVSPDQFLTNDRCTLGIIIKAIKIKKRLPKLIGGIRCQIVGRDQFVLDYLGNERSLFLCRLLSGF